MKRDETLGLGRDRQLFRSERTAVSSDGASNNQLKTLHFGEQLALSAPEFRPANSGPLASIPVADNLAIYRSTDKRLIVPHGVNSRLRAWDYADHNFKSGI